MLQCNNKKNLYIAKWATVAITAAHVQTSGCCTQCDSNESIRAPVTDIKEDVIKANMRWSNNTSMLVREWKATFELLTVTKTKYELLTWTDKISCNANEKVLHFKVGPNFTHGNIYKSWSTKQLSTKHHRQRITQLPHSSLRGQKNWTRPPAVCFWARVRHRCTAVA